MANQDSCEKEVTALRDYLGSKYGKNMVANIKDMKHGVSIVQTRDGSYNLTSKGLEYWPMHKGHRAATIEEVVTAAQEAGITDIVRHLQSEYYKTAAGARIVGAW